MKSKTKLAIIGGTSMYDMNRFKLQKEHIEETPWGYTSSKVSFISSKTDFVFIPRHGDRHQHPPHQVPYKANIAMLKKLGIKYVIGLTTVGSLTKEFKIGEIVIPAQLIDKTNILTTYFEDLVVGHASMANPFSKILDNYLRKLLYKEINHSSDATLLTISGPRFATRAESIMHKSLGCDLVGMTTAYEAGLCKEIGLEYIPVAIVTDYDSWLNTGEDVSAKEVIQNLKMNKEKLLSLVEKIVQSFDPDDLKDQENILNSDAILNKDFLSTENKIKMGYIFPDLLTKD